MVEKDPNAVSTKKKKMALHIAYVGTAFRGAPSVPICVRAATEADCVLLLHHIETSACMLFSSIKARL